MHALSIRRQFILAALLGAATVLGFAPFYIYPIPIATIAGLFLLWQRSTTPKQAAWLGLIFGLGLFNTGIYWIYISLHDFGGMPFWMAAIATFTLNAFLALFPAMVGWLSKRNRYLLMTAPLLWVLSEWVRSWIFTGFPWLAVGYSQIPYSPLAGFAPLFGAYGVSLLVAVAASALVFWSAKRRRLVLFLLVLWVAGSILKHVEWSEPYHPPISVALLQGNIAQDMKWQPEIAQQTMDQYLSMAQDSQAQLIVMPETALPTLVQQLPAQYIEQLKQHALQQHGDILFGAVEQENNDYYNSIVSVGSAPTQVYRKSHLVPFGEFIPLKGIFGWIYRDWLNIPLTDMSRGDIHQKPLNVAGQRVAVNICYEDVFGEEIIRQLPQATLLVNVSNDAWYGESLAADQHLQMSQTRAMETARMVLRSTNTGATAVINREGRVVAQLPHFTTAVLTAQAQGYTGATPYTRWGNWPIISFILIGLGILWSRKRTTD
ncbi:MAG TPA: apolipoprotein N-acyltransferase [Methylophilaceae bacterium]